MVNGEFRRGPRRNSPEFAGAYLKKKKKKKIKKLPRYVLGVKIIVHKNFFLLRNLLLEVILYKYYSTKDVYQLKFILKVKTKDKLKLKKVLLAKTLVVN